MDLLNGIRGLWTQQPESSVDDDGNVLLVYDLDGIDGIAVVYWAEPRCIGGYRELVSGGLMSGQMLGIWEDSESSDPYRGQSSWHRLTDDLWSHQPVATRLGDPWDWVDIHELVCDFADHLKSLAWVIRLEVEMTDAVS